MSGIWFVPVQESQRSAFPLRLFPLADGSYHETDKYADLEIFCQDKNFWVHRMVMSQSPFFAAACDGDFREALEQRVEIHDDDPEIVEKMIEFMYRGCYKEEKPVNDDTLFRAIELNMAIWRIGDKYNIAPLCAYSGNRVIFNLKSELITAEMLSMYARTILETTSPIQKDLREAVIDLMVARMERLEKLDVLELESFGMQTVLQIMNALHRRNTELRGVPQNSPRKPLPTPPITATPTSPPPKQSTASVFATLQSPFPQPMAVPINKVPVPKSNSLLPNAKPRSPRGPKVSKLEC